jgi:hypothetical protein
MASQHPKTLRLIGDLLADRGANDYLMLSLLQHLNGLNISLRILFSNHDNIFMTHFEKSASLHSQFISLDRLDKALKRDYVVKDSVLEMKEKVYEPVLRLIDCSIIDNKITLFTHAPVEIDVILKLAGVSRDKVTQENLIAGIERFNARVKTLIAKKDYSILEGIDENLKSFEEILACDPKNNIQDFVTYLTWNRMNLEATTNIEKRPATLGELQIEYVHGHDTVEIESPLKHVKCLDTSSGKGPRNLAALETLEERARIRVATDCTTAAYLAIAKYREIEKEEAEVSRKKGDLESKPKRTKDEETQIKSLEENRKVLFNKRCDGATEFRKQLVDTVVAEGRIACYMASYSEETQLKPQKYYYEKTNGGYKIDHLRKGFGGEMTPSFKSIPLDDENRSLESPEIEKYLLKKSL